MTSGLVENMAEIGSGKHGGKIYLVENKTSSGKQNQ
jgi:hypothetical protein